jgi:hypothetical protein
MAIPAHLTIKTDGLPFDTLLSDWRWLVSSDFTPVLMTAFGDLFLRDQSGRIHFLDLMSGEFKPVAESQEEFDRLCEDREQRRSWFVGFLLTEVRKTRGELAAGECYLNPAHLAGKLVRNAQNRGLRPETAAAVDHFSSGRPPALSGLSF